MPRHLHQISQMTSKVIKKGSVSGAVVKAHKKADA
jgi:hypothetical protein